MTVGVYEASLRAQLQAAHEAILTIWQCHRGWLQGVTDGDDVDQALYAAAALLPADMRTEDMAAPPKLGRSDAQFADLLE